jgi:hypothetical protein
MKNHISITEDRFLLTESELRQAEIDKHVAAFLRKGGKVQELASNASGYASDTRAQPFVIKSHVLPPKKSKQYWKEHKHGKRTTGV